MSEVAARIRPLLERLGRLEGSSVAFRLWDGGRLGPRDARATVVVRSPKAIARIVRAPRGLGLGRAYVAGDLDVEGELDAVLRLGEGRPGHSLGPRGFTRALRAAASVGALRPARLPPPPEEARLRGRRHSRTRDAAAISHHYDVSNDFYRIVLGPSMTYSCAYFDDHAQSLEDAQADKHDLVCRKLRLKAGERLLDVGCGWGSLVIHAAQRYGVNAVGVTISRPQADLAAKRVADAGVADRVEIRLQDERDVEDGPYDAVASVGMFEHVGEERLSEYFRHLHALLRPQGRLLNHGISRPPGVRNARFGPGSFLGAYVFPDGELHEVGAVMGVVQEAGFEVRDVESLREHYALTLRHWVSNLERNRDEAVSAAGEGRYRVWRMYMAASARGFEAGRAQVHQILAVRSDDGVSGVPLRRTDFLS